MYECLIIFFKALPKIFKENIFVVTEICKSLHLSQPHSVTSQFLIYFYSVFEPS